MRSSSRPTRRYSDLSDSDASIESSRSSSVLSYEEKGPWDVPATRPRARHTPWLLALFVASNVAYLLSLRPASSPKDMSSKLGLLGALLVFSSATVTAYFWISLLSTSLLLRTRAFFLATELLSILSWIVIDTGNSLQSHGAYNLLIFTLITAPLNFVLAALILWYRSCAHPSKFWTQLFFTFIFATVVIVSGAKYKERALLYGFNGQTIPRLGVDACQWDNAIPWFDLLPFRLNFFTGPMTCPVINSFDASFDENDKLVIDCKAKSTEVASWLAPEKKHRFDGAAYAVLPRTETWGLQMKNDSLTAEVNMLQQNVLQYAEEHLEPYYGPVSPSGESDTVLAFCGSSASKLVWRIRPVMGEKGGLLEKPHDDGLNVVTIFIDAVSRQQFHRRLPRTRAVLEELVNAKDATASLFEFWRYHTVGLNTSPNTRALWAGMGAVEDSRPEEAMPPLWEQFEAAGYASARLDPMCQDWATYYDPAEVPANSSTVSRVSHEHIAWSCFPPYLPVGQHFAGNFAGSTSIKARCISGTHVGWHAFDWSSTFLAKYHENGATPRATYLNAAFMEGHEGSGAVLASLDERFSDFLHPKKGPIDYSNTAVVIISDHGALMGLNYAFLENGRVEAANPFAAMVLPRDYLAKGDRRRRVKTASRELVTAFDFYETMRGLMGGVRDERYKSAAGVDFLHEDLEERDCTAAGVAEAACKCH